jgi:hypothetical protein
MLPQPNFGRDKEPDRGAPEPEAADGDEKPRKKLLRLQIAMWVQALSAVVAGNLAAYLTFLYRGATLEDLTELYENPDYLGPIGSAQGDFDYYQSSSFLIWTLTVAGLTVLAAIVATLCAIRFKTRLKAVRWTAVGATAVLFVCGMLMSTLFYYYVAPWVFASVLALWWLFASDIRHWMNKSAKRAPRGD